METQVTVIAPDIYRLSTYLSDADSMFNQFLIDADQRCCSTPSRARLTTATGPTIRALADPGAAHTRSDARSDLCRELPAGVPRPGGRL